MPRAKEKAATSAPPARKKEARRAARTTMCEHRLGPDQHCKTCDA